MCPAALLLALLVAVHDTPSTQRLDASSDAALEQTTAAARNKLSEEQRPKFDQAVKILMGDFVEKQDDEISKEQFVAGWRVTLHGKTANEVLVAAEAVVRKMMIDYAKKQATTVSRTLPAPIDARGTSFACDSLLNTSIKLEQVDQAEYFTVTETSLLKSDAEIRALLDRRQLAAAANTGTDTLAVEIIGSKLQVMTRASVEIGQASPATFAIGRNDDRVLLAYAVDEAVLGLIFDSLLLNKKNGFAVWTKSRAASLLGDEPTTQSIYLRCK